MKKIIFIFFSLLLLCTCGAVYAFKMTSNSPGLVYCPKCASIYLTRTTVSKGEYEYVCRVCGNTVFMEQTDSSEVRPAPVDVREHPAENNAKK